MVVLMTDEEIEGLESTIPEFKAMSLFMIRYSDPAGNMLCLMDDREMLDLCAKDRKFKELCTILFDALISTSNGKSNMETERVEIRRKFSVQLDRALLWRGMYDLMDSKF